MKDRTTLAEVKAALPLCRTDAERGVWIDMTQRLTREDRVELWAWFFNQAVERVKSESKTATFH